MSADAVVTALLAGAGAVTSLVGDRIYPVVLPQGKPTPAIVYEQVSLTRPPAIDAGAPTHLTQARMQVNLLGPDYAQLLALRNAVVLALQFQRGLIAATTVHSVQHSGEGPVMFDRGLELFHRSVDFIITHEAN